MSNITVKFIGKEYSIPEDVLTYIDLLDFTDGVHKNLASTFVRKLRNEIAKDNIGLLGDEDLAAEIEQQVGKYIAKLCDNGIFTRTISDYLKNNKGYQLYSDVNKAALEKMKSLLIQEMDAWQAGYENAVNKAESHVTGMGFSIWSSSFVNHAIYAAMEASTLNKQGKEAEAQYQKDMNDLRSRLDSQYGGEKSNYINNTYIPNMEAALTVFAYELLDKYVADMIANGKFDSKTLDYVDIGRSNDLLKNLTLSNNKQAVLENAFAACPYNIAVYMQAMKYDLLDYDSFQTAKVFKQDHHVLSFFRESWGEVSFPTKFNINYHCINVWASLTGKSSADLLRGLTEQYATGIVKAYSRVADMAANKSRCVSVIGELRDDAVLSGDSICKGKAREYVDSIVSLKIWEQLTEQCGHLDLLERIKKHFPTDKELQTKKDLDTHILEILSLAFEEARQVVVIQIGERKQEEERRRIEREYQKAEQEKQEQERRKKNKKIAAIVTPIIAIVVVFFIILSTVIIPNNKYTKAISLQESGDYRAAIELYNSLGDYKDATKRCIDLWGKITFRETISAEYRHTVALKTNGTVVAVGDDQYGRTDVSDWTDIIAVSAGINYTLGLKSDGTVVAVGADNNDKCEVGNWKNIVAIGAGTDHSVGLKSDGTVVAIGANSDDECDVSGWTNIIAIAVGDSHTVGLRADGTVVATGGTKYGRCDVEDWTDIVAIAAGDVYTLGLKADGTVVFAGTGSYGLIIEYVEDWTDIVAISASDNHILGLKSDGTVVVTGDNDEGQCNVSKWKNIVAIAAGYEHSVGLMADGTVVATGSNEYGQCNVSKWKDIRVSSSNIEYDEYLLDKEKIEYASKILGRRCDESGNISLNADLGNFINGDNPLFGEDGHFELGAYSEDSKGLKIDTLDWVSNDKVKDFSKIVAALQTLYGEPFYTNAIGDEYAWSDIGIYEEILCVRNNDKTATIRWVYRVSDPENQSLDESLKTDLEKMKEYASYIKGAEANVLKDYPHFEDDGDTYYQCEDHVFGISGYYKFEYFEGKISSVRFTWIPSDWHHDEEYVVDCLKKCFGDFTGYSELLDDEWFCYSWEDTTSDNLKVSYYIAEDEGEILIRAK